MNNKRGFTMIELMVAIAIISILAAVAVPNFEAWLSGHRLSSSARDIYSLYQLARLRAVKEKSDVLVSINDATGEYSAFADNGNGGGITNNGVQDGTEPTIKFGTLEKGVSIVGVSAPQIRFTSRGFPRAPFGTTVTIKNIENVQKQIILSQNGHVRIP